MEKLLDLIAGQPLALVSLGVALAVILAVRYLGLWQGQHASPAASAGSAQVAAVIVDFSALNRASAAVEAFNMSMIEANGIAKSHATATNRLAQATEELGDGVDRLRDEVIRSTAKLG